MLSTVGSGESELGQVTAPVVSMTRMARSAALLVISFAINQADCQVRDIELYSESARACVEDNYDKSCHSLGLAGDFNWFEIS